jgi:ATP synthase protein I
MNVVLRLAGLQAASALTVAIIWWLAKDGMHGFAALVGGAIAAILTLYAGVQTFARPSTDPQQIARRFVAAQYKKWGLAVLLFALAFSGLAEHAVPLIVAFMVGVSLYKVALLWD